jgi:hypothetical protein
VVRTSPAYNAANVCSTLNRYSNANNLVNEIPNPVRTLKVYSNIALGVVSVLYVLAAVSFFAFVLQSIFCLPFAYLSATELFRRRRLLLPTC